MSKNPNLIELKELEVEGQEPYDFLRRDVKLWIEENQAAQVNQVSKDMLYTHLSEKIDITPRQLRRYLDGATEISVKKAIALCKEIGLKGIFEFANYQLGLDTCDIPTIPFNEQDNYDAAEELINNVNAFSKQAGVLAKSMNEKPSVGMLHKIRVASMEARKQILQCERLYDAMLRQRCLSEYRKAADAKKKRAQKKQEELNKAGQGGLFEFDS